MVFLNVFFNVLKSLQMTAPFGGSIETSLWNFLNLFDVFMQFKGCFLRFSSFFERFPLFLEGLSEFFEGFFSFSGYKTLHKAFLGLGSLFQVEKP